MMLAEFVKTLCSISDEAAGAKVVQIPGMPRHLQYVHYPGQLDLKKIPVPAEPRSYKSFTLNDLIEAAKHFAGGEQPLVVFCGRGNVTAVLDEEEERRERLNFPLPKSHEFVKLEVCEARREPFAQKGFIKLLRIDLAGAVDQGLLASVRDLKFRKTEGGHAKVDTGKESMGLDIEREVMCSGALPPDETTLTLSVYRDLPEGELKQQVKCAVDLDVSEMTFTLIPLAGELEKAQRETDAAIKQRISAGLPDAKVFCGAP